MKKISALISLLTAALVLADGDPSVLQNNNSNLQSSPKQDIDIEQLLVEVPSFKPSKVEVISNKPSQVETDKKEMATEGSPDEDNADGILSEMESPDMSNAVDNEQILSEQPKNDETSSKEIVISDPETVRVVPKINDLPNVSRTPLKKDGAFSIALSQNFVSTKLKDYQDTGVRLHYEEKTTYSYNSNIYFNLDGRVYGKYSEVYLNFTNKDENHYGGFYIAPFGAGYYNSSYDGASANAFFYEGSFGFGRMSQKGRFSFNIEGAYRYSLDGTFNDDSSHQYSGWRADTRGSAHILDDVSVYVEAGSTGFAAETRMTNTQISMGVKWEY